MTYDGRTKASFANIVDQSPGSVIEGRTYKILALDSQFYLLSIKDGTCSVFTIYPEVLKTLPASEHGCSAWHYLCAHQAPKDGVKEFRFSVNLNRGLKQSALNFAKRVSTKFNLAAAQQVFSAFSS